MAKRKAFSKKGLAGFVKNVKDRIPKHPVMDAAVGVGSGYLATRVVSSVAVGVVNKTRFAKYSGYAGSAASVLGVGLVWMLATHIDGLKKYKNTMLAGSILAAIQQLIVTHIPALSWLAAPPVSFLLPAAGMDGTPNYYQDTGSQTGDANQAAPMLQDSYETADEEPDETMVWDGALRSVA